MSHHRNNRGSFYYAAITTVLGLSFLGAGCTSILPSQENTNVTTNDNNETSVNVNKNPDDPCSEFTEDQCFAASACQGMYGPSACQGSYCTADVRYKGCRTISEDTLKQAEKDKQRCEQTEGQWVVNTYNKPGSCDCGSNRGFDSAEGCILK